MTGTFDRRHLDPGLAPDDALELEAKLDAAWEEGYAAAEGNRTGRVIGLVLAAISAAVLAAAITVAVVHATSRSAQLDRPPAGPSGAPRVGMLVEVPRADAGGEVAAPVASVGAPFIPPAAVLSPPPEVITEPAAIAHGLASYVAASYGPRYLALPDGPGLTVTICGPAACVTRTSTDAGPDLAMQRKGRIADLSFADFATVCGCTPRLIGTVEVTIQDGAGVTPPPTDP